MDHLFTFNQKQFSEQFLPIGTNRNYRKVATKMKIKSDQKTSSKEVWRNKRYDQVHQIFEKSKKKEQKFKETGLRKFLSAHLNFEGNEVLRINNAKQQNECTNRKILSCLNSSVQNVSGNLCEVTFYNKNLQTASPPKPKEQEPLAIRRQPKKRSQSLNIPKLSMPKNQKKLPSVFKKRPESEECKKRYEKEQTKERIYSCKGDLEKCKSKDFAMNENDEMTNMMINRKIGSSHQYKPIKNMRIKRKLPSQNFIQSQNESRLQTPESILNEEQWCSKY